MFEKDCSLSPHSISDSLIIAEHYHMSTRDEKHHHMTYEGEKPDGSDVGNMFMLKGELCIGKIGITRSLGMQAVDRFVRVYLPLQALIAKPEFAERLAKMPRLDPEAQAELALAVAEATKDSKKFSEKWHTFLGYILGNFFRAINTRVSDTETKKLNKTLQTAFKAYLASAEGIALQEKMSARIKEREELERQAKNTGQRLPVFQIMTSKEVYALFKAMLAHEPKTENENEDDKAFAALRADIGYAAFTDQMCGLAQMINNQIMTATDPRMAVARHRLLVTKKEPGFYQVSTFLPEALPAQEFLLKPFLAEQAKDESNAAWVERCKQTLEQQLAGKSIRGLVKALLIRQVFGEVGDLGLDNLMFMSTKEGFDVVNIDISGPRYSREKDYDDKRKNETSLGWAPTLVSTSEEEILTRLFDSTVFSPRAINDSEALTAHLSKGGATEERVKAMKKMIYTALVEVLKTKVKDAAVNEVAEVRDWFADLNPEALNADCANVMTRAYDNLHPDLSFDRKYLEAYKGHFASFINRPHEIAKAWKAEHQPTPTAQVPSLS